MRKRFAEGKRKTVIEQIKAGIQARIMDMAKLNKNRLEFMKKYQELLDTYNSQDANLEQFFNELIRFTQELTQEEKRHIEENLTEEELAVYDILMKPAPELTKEEIKTVKQTAKELLATLKREKLVAGWRRMQSARAKVKVAINDKSRTRLQQETQVIEIIQALDDNTLLYIKEYILLLKQHFPEKI